MERTGINGAAMVILLTCFMSFVSIGQNASDLNSLSVNDEAAVKAAVDSFLVALGRGDVERVKALFLPNANIGSVVMREGVTKIYTSSFEDFIAKREAGRNFEEPVRTYTVNISQGLLAFVRADATVVIDDIPDHFTDDFFILMKEDGEWKFLSGSYTSYPLEETK